MASTPADGITQLLREEHAGDPRVYLDIPYDDSAEMMLLMELETRTLQIKLVEDQLRKLMNTVNARSLFTNSFNLILDHLRADLQRLESELEVIRGC